MLCALCNMAVAMARGESGRIVVEVEPDLKAALYVALAKEGLTLKAWFIREAEGFVGSLQQPGLFAAEPQPPAYRVSRDLKERS